MASNLRVDTILPSTGTSLGIGTASGTTTVTNNLSVTGSINAASATITGNLGVGGVLTYEDVTNIDSVGIITARSGIHIDDSITHIGDTNTKIRFSGADTIKLETGGTERLRVDSTGDTIVSGILFADSDLFVTDQIRHTGDTNTAIRFPAADTFTVETSGSERVRIQNGGLKLNGGSYIVECSEGHGAPNNNTKQMDQRRWMWYGTSSSTHTVARVAKASSGQPGDGDSQLAAWIVTYTARSMYGFNSDGGYSVMKMRTGRFDYDDNEVRFSTEQDTLGTGSGSQNPTIVFTDEGSGVVRISITNPSSTHSFGEINLMTYDCRITLPTG